MVVNQILGNSQILGNASVVDLRGSDDASVDLSNISWLSEATYTRVGPDLVLESPSGEQSFLIGYYDAPAPMDLIGTGGTKIPAHIVDVLDGSQTAGQYAQAGNATNLESIGQAETVEGSVYAVRVDGTRVQLEQGDDVYQGDTLETGEDGIVGITFADESTLSLDADARMVIDEMVYDPGTQDGSATLFVLQGAMSFVSGSIAKANPDAMSIDTPIATIGIRGTSTLISVTPAGDVSPNQSSEGVNSPQVTLVLMPEANPDGSTFTGEAVITTSAGSQVVNGNFQGTSISSPNQVPSTPQIVSLIEVGRVFGPVVSTNPNQGSVPQTLKQAVQKVLVQMDAEKAVEKAKKAVDDLKKEIAQKEADGEDTEALEGELALAEDETEQAEGDLENAEADVLDAAAELGAELGIEGLGEKKVATIVNKDPVVDQDSADTETQTSPPVTVITTPQPISAPLKKTIVIEDVVTAPEPDPIYKKPTDIELSSKNVDENAAGVEIALITATDEDSNADQLTYEIVNDPSGIFIIVGDKLRLKEDTSADFEAIPHHSVTIKVTDDANLSYTEEFTINVNDLSDGSAPTSITLGNVTFNETEFGASVGILSTADVDPGETFTYVINNVVGVQTGADLTSYFEIINGDELKLIDSKFINYEIDNAYSFTITVTDSKNNSYQEVISNVSVFDLTGETLTINSSQSLSVTENTDFDITVASGGTLHFSSGASMTNNSHLLEVQTGGVAYVENNSSSTIMGGGTIYGAMVFESTGGGTFTAYDSNLTIESGYGSLIANGSGTNVINMVSGEVINNQDLIVSSNLTVNGNLQNASGGAIAIELGATLTLNGDFTSAMGSALQGGGHLILNGTTNTISDSILDLSFANFETLSDGISYTLVTSVNTPIGKIGTYIGLTSNYDFASTVGYLAKINYVPTGLSVSYHNVDITTNGAPGHAVSGSDTAEFIAGVNDANDFITGGGGADVMAGGGGADRFRYEMISDSTSTDTDQILDFESAEDRIVLLRPLTVGSFSYQGSAGFTGGGNASARFSDADELLKIDINGDGVEDMRINLLGVRATDLSHSNFKFDLGQEVKINTHKAGYQQGAKTTTLSDGGWISVWESNNQDGDSWGVYAQRYNADGSKFGSEFQVNTTSSSEQRGADVVELSNGDILIAWSDYGNAFGGSVNDIVATRFDVSGTPIPGAIEMTLNANGIINGNQDTPVLIALPGGGFALTYRSETSGVAGTDYSDVYLKTFDASNNEISIDVKLNDYITQHQDMQDSALGDNMIITVWQSNLQDVAPGPVNNLGIYAKIVDISDPANPIFGPEIHINTTLENNQTLPAVTVLDDGSTPAKFVVTWTSEQDGSDTGIYFQIIDSTGTKIGGETLVNTTTLGTQTDPDIAALQGGGFVIVWEGQGDDPTVTPSQYGIFGQRFFANGTKDGDEFLINQNIWNDQLDPKITVLADGDFIVTWDTTNGSQSNVASRRYNADGTDHIAMPAPNHAPELTMQGLTASFAPEQSFGAAPSYRDVKLVDVDGDGDLDAILAQNDITQTVVRLNDGTGNLGTETVISATAGDIATADFNGDGIVDFVSATGNVYLGDDVNTDGKGDGTFSAGFASIAGTNVATADIDNDGDMDIVVLGATNKVYKNDGTGSFTDTGQTLGTANQGFKFGDFDKDGDLDMIIGGTTGKVEVWENDGAGIYSLSSTINMTDAYGNTGSTTYDIEVADFNGDGHLDVWTTNREAGNILLTNDGTGNLTFTNAGTFGPASAGTTGPNDREGSASDDLDGDGDIDVITSRWDGEDEYWINDGSGNFTDANASGAFTTNTINGQNVAIGDLNGDGFNDVFSANVGADSEVIANQTNSFDYCYLTDTPINPFSNLNIADADSTQMVRAQLSIDGFAAGDTLAVTTPGGLNVHYDAATGVLNITGTGTIAEYQTAIQSIAFTSTTDATLTDRKLELSVTDATGKTSGTMTTIVKFINTDPIAIDLDGDGVELLSAANGVAFDVDADGDKDNIGWVGADDGLLVSDLNGDGVINDMTEVISPEFNLDDKNDGTITSSLEVLSLYDDNKDGIINASDKIYNKLQVWQDVNSNGVTDEGELKSLADQGITSITLEHKVVDETQEGNVVSKEGSVTFEDGHQSEWTEVGFDMTNNANNFDEAALFNEVVAPLLDTEDPMAIIANAQSLELNGATQDQTFDEISLLKEIVGPMMDKDAMPTLTDAQLISTTTQTSSSLTITNNNTDTSTAAIAITEVESYTTSQTVEDTLLTQAAE